MIILNKKDCDINNSQNKEWIVTNGLGGYSSSTIIGLNTKKTHGLLFSSINHNNYLILSKLDETLILNDKIIELSTNQYPGIIHPKGYKYQDGFIYNFFPTFHYNINGIKISKSIIMLQDHNAIIISYLITSQKDFTIKIKPLINYRPIHGLSTNIPVFNQTSSQNVAIIKPNTNKSSVIIIASDKAKYHEKSSLVYNMKYNKESDSLENHYCPGEFSVNIKRGMSRFNVICAADENKKAYTSFNDYYSNDPQDFKIILDREIIRCNDYIKSVTQINNTKSDILLNNLVFITSQFITNSNLVLNSYDSSFNYTRELLISMTGSLLIHGKFKESRRMLEYIASKIHKGIIPCIITENGILDYKSIDTSLWYIYAVYQYYKYSNDIYFIKKQYNTMRDIIKNYENGTLYQIKMDEDFLIKSDYEYPLTWMKTIRKGKCVEVNSLWYNALKIINYFTKKLNYKTKHYDYLSKMSKNSFNKEFWNKNKNYLYDRTEKDIKDISIRPNPLIAISLNFEIIDVKKKFMIMKKINEELLTPFGIRSLSKNDYRFNNSVESSLCHSNVAVFPWLLGFYVTTYLKLNNNSEKSKKECESKIFNNILKLKDNTLGLIPEFFYDEINCTSGGSINYLISTAEILRAYVECLKK